jgi:uncharacterized membrane protein YvbJ
MFCSKCGNQLSAGLNYCNRCGTPVNKIDAETRIGASAKITEALPYIGVFGFAGFIFLIVILLKNQVPEKVLILLSLFYLATLFGICFSILQSSNNSIGKSESAKNDSPDFVPLVELPAKNTNQLHEYREPAISVTEETTRNFEKVPRREN